METQQSIKKNNSPTIINLSKHEPVLPKMNLHKRKVIVNKIQCKLCLEIIESTHVHDFKMCKCGKCGVDGGNEYLRRIGSQNMYSELSEWSA